MDTFITTPSAVFIECFAIVYSAFDYYMIAQVYKHEFKKYSLK